MNKEKVRKRLYVLENEYTEIGFQPENRKLLEKEILRLRDLRQQGKVDFLNEQEIIRVASLCVGVSVFKKKPKRSHPASQPPSTYKTVPVI